MKNLQQRRQIGQTSRGVLNLMKMDNGASVSEGLRFTPSINKVIRYSLLSDKVGISLMVDVFEAGGYNA